MGSAFHLGQIGHARTDGTDAVEQVQPVAADRLVVGIDLNGLEKGVDRGAERGHRRHRGGEVFRFHGRGDDGFRSVEGREQGAFFGRFGEFDVRALGIFNAVLLFRLRQDRVGALEALQQVRAIVGLEEGGEGAGAVDKEGEVVIAGHGQAGVDDIMADALITQVGFQAVVQEGEEVVGLILYSAPIFETNSMREVKINHLADKWFKGIRLFNQITIIEIPNDP